MSKTRRINKILLVLMLISITVSALHATTVEKIVATVDGIPITMLDLDEAVKTIGKEIQKEQNVSGAELRAKVLDKIIDNKVLENAQKNAAIKVEPHEIDQFIDRLLRSSQISMETFEFQLKERGMTMAEYRQRVHDEIRRNKFMEQELSRKITVSESELKDYFYKNIDQFLNPKSAQLSQITLLFSKDTKQEDIEKMMLKASEIAEAARNTVSFEALAAKYNNNPYPVVGVDLGFINLKDLQPIFAEAAKTLKGGEVSRPFLTNVGIHIVKVINRAKASPKDFPFIRDNVYNIVYNIKMKKALEGFVRELRRKANIEIKGLGS